MQPPNTTNTRESRNQEKLQHNNHHPPNWDQARAQNSNSTVDQKRR